MKAACIAGGGSWGAYTVGKLYELKENYDIVIGCSTGSLMAPLVALGEYERLKEAYTSISSKDIFSVNPFKSNGKIKTLQSIWRIIRNKKTIGETHSLRETIKRFFTIEDYYKILASNKEVLVTACNISKSKNFTEYISIRDVSYERFVDFMWASASVPIVGTIVEIDGDQYSDGGTTEGLPLLKILQYNCEQVDCFLHETRKDNSKHEKVNDIFHLGGRIIGIMREEMQKDNLLTGMLLAEVKNVKNIRVSYLPTKLNQNILVFDKKLMSEWVELGRINANNW